MTMSVMSWEKQPACERINADYYVQGRRIKQSIHLSIYSMPIARQWCILGLWLLQDNRKHRTGNETQLVGLVTELAKTATKLSSALLQKHSLGDAICWAGAVWQYRLGQLRYSTTAVWALDSQYLHRMPPSNCCGWGRGHIILLLLGRYLGPHFRKFLGRS